MPSAPDPDVPISLSVVDDVDLDCRAQARRVFVPSVLNEAFDRLETAVTERVQDQVWSSIIMEMYDKGVLKV